MELERVIQVEDRYYILATTTLADDRTRVLKDQELFALFDRFGDVQPLGSGAQGIYRGGTRFLCRLELLLDGQRPLLLSSNVREDNLVLSADLTNPDLRGSTGDRLAADTLHLERTVFLRDPSCFSRIRVHNYGSTPVSTVLSLRFAADFADLFEVRGMRRPRRGETHPPSRAGNAVTLAYTGLDGVQRAACFGFSPPPQHLDGEEARFDLHLPPGAAAELHMVVTSREGSDVALGADATTYDVALDERGRGRRESRTDHCQLSTTDAHFDRWLQRSYEDLRMLTTRTPQGPYPYAGTPWFSTVFGRDGILTALQTLWLDPTLARGVLAHLAATQATTEIPERDAEPGRILHESRNGEMAALGEIPFAQYYGSVDGTPLFVVLAGAYLRRSGDHAFLAGLWPALERALGWLDTHGDADGDGYVEYGRRSPQGLVHQGWKDSHDAVFHADGTLAQGPIALCEVQGYVYAARLAGAYVAAALGRHTRARQLRRQATVLKRCFARDFWSRRLGTYVLALDGRKRPCEVRASNAGQCLWTGIAQAEAVSRLAHTLLDEPFFSGWGVRTVASTEARYNPLSYHNGSVWPHDNAWIALGLARCGHRRQALRIFEGLFDASRYFDLNRLPELFCGFARREGEAPTLYPVACTPQAWSAAAVFLLLQAALGLEIDGVRGEVQLRQPRLPAFLDEVVLEGLRAGEGRVDLRLGRHRHGVGVEILRRRGPVRVTISK